jgi:hypothetical protein
LITRKIFGEEYRAWSSSSCSLFHSPVTSSLFGPDIFLRAPFSKILSLHYFLSDSDQVSHPYNATSKRWYFPYPQCEVFRNGERWSVTAACVVIVGSCS